MNSQRHRAIEGSLLGTAAGDALGLPFEGLSRQRVARFNPGELRHRLVLGRGLLSDDTEHALMLAAALTQHWRQPQAVQQRFAAALRWWLLALPAGVGLSTAKAIVRLWLGFPAHRSGVHSAGNGAAMRTAVIGAAFYDRDGERHALAAAACEVTHRSSLALESVRLVTEATAMAAAGTDTAGAVQRLKSLCESPEMQDRFARLEPALAAGLPVPEYAAAIGCGHGVSGFAPNTVAVALYAWLHHRGDFASMITQAVRCGGDTDSVAAIAGGIGGAEVGEEGIPKAWIAGMADWPRSVRYIRQTAACLAHAIDGTQSRPARWCWPLIPLRNLLFLAIVIAHGFRRLLPPY